MSKKVVQTFVNRNPRNLEFLKLQPKNTGWGFEKDREQRNFIYKAILTTSPHHTTGQIVHYDDGVVLSVSTRDPGISSQLYSNVDTSAAFNIGRALAQKCLNSGIKNSIKAIDDQSYERSSRKKAFFNALQTAGISLSEPGNIPQNFLNDPNFTWQHYPVQHNRQDKLDELFDKK